MVSAIPQNVFATDDALYAINRAVTVERMLLNGYNRSRVSDLQHVQFIAHYLYIDSGNNIYLSSISMHAVMRLLERS